jgi:hypothetical protein
MLPGRYREALRGLAPQGHRGHFTRERVEPTLRFELRTCCLRTPRSPPNADCATFCNVLSHDFPRGLPFDAQRYSCACNYRPDTVGSRPGARREVPREAGAPETHLRIVCPPPDFARDPAGAPPQHGGRAIGRLLWGGRTKIERPFTSGVERHTVASWVTRAAGVEAIDQLACRLMCRSRGDGPRP